MDMDLGFGLRPMHVRCPVRFGQAMRRGVGQGERGMRRDHAKRVERREREGRVEPESPGETSQHRALCSPGG
jgi:hypothetical protein